MSSIQQNETEVSQEKEKIRIHSDSKETEEMKDSRIVAKGLLGTVTWFSVRKGFGFISRQDSEVDIFVHSSMISAPNHQHWFHSLADGEKVCFDVAEGEKGLEAINVTAENGGCVQGSDSAISRGYLNPGAFFYFASKALLNYYGRGAVARYYGPPHRTHRNNSEGNRKVVNVVSETEDQENKEVKIKEKRGKRRKYNWRSAGVKRPVSEGKETESKEKIAMNRSEEQDDGENKKVKAKENGKRYRSKHKQRNAKSEAKSAGVGVEHVGVEIGEKNSEAKEKQTADTKKGKKSEKETANKVVVKAIEGEANSGI